MKPYIIIKTTLLALITCVALGLAFLTIESLKDEQHFNEKIKTSLSIVNISGKIKTAKTFYEGRKHNNIMIYVPTTSPKKWIYFTGTDGDDEDALKEGGNITLQAYPRRSDSVVRYNPSNTVLYGLGYSVNGKEIKSNDYMFQQKAKGFTFYKTLMAFSFLIIIAFWLYIFVFGNENNMVLRRK